VRHGATTLTAEDRFAGSSNVSLSEEGRRQVTSLAQRLENEQLHAIYCSPLDRTVETATILAAPHKLTPVREPGLREIDYGHWEGLSRSEIEGEFGDEYGAWQEDPFTIGPHEGESGVNVLNRALPVMRRIVEDNRHKNVLIVAHKGVNRILISSLSILDFMSDVHARLRLLNDVSHYEGVPARILTERLSAWWGKQR
jgi:probable phosphoglycerate mutase